MIRGLAKSRYLDEGGKQIITRFWKENEMVLPKGAFMENMVSLEDIILLEDTKLLSLSHKEMEHAYNTFLETHVLSRNNPTDAQVDALIANYSFLCDALKIGETMEQAHAIPPESSWLKRFYSGIRAIQKSKFIDKGIPALVCYNYFHFWPNSYHLGQVAPNVSKENFRKPLDQLEHTNFSPGGSLSTTNLIMEAVYLGPPDIQQNQIYDLAYKLLLFKRMGYESGVFLAGEHEWNPNNMFLSQYPDGKYYSQGKIPLDPNVLITSTIFSQVYGRVFVQWGGAGKAAAGRIFNRFTFEPTFWKKNGSTEYKTSSVNPNWNGGANGDVFHYQSNPDFPHMKTGGVGYYGYNGNTDLARFALQVYAETWGQIGDDGT